MILGLLFIRPVPFPETERSSSLESGENEVSGTDSPSAIFARENTSRTHLLAEADEGTSEDGQPSPSSAYRRRGSQAGRIGFGESGKLLADGSNNLSGRAMFATFDFWLLFTIMSLRTSILIVVLITIDEKYSWRHRDYVYVFA